MSPESLAILAAVGSFVLTAAGALAIGLIKGSFTRNIGVADKAQTDMQADIKAILAELRSMHDESTRQRADIAALGKDLATLAASIKAAHDRIDALVSPTPERRKR